MVAHKSGGNHGTENLDGNGIIITERNLPTYCAGCAGGSRDRVINECACFVRSAN
jgi:hypothetical protein